MGQCLCRCACAYRRDTNIEDIDFISEKSLRAVEELVTLLKHYARYSWIFRPGIRCVALEEKIYNALKKGKRRTLHRLVTRDKVPNGVAGLQMFLSNLGQPVLPPFIQALATEDIRGIASDVIAVDMLGLVRQNLLPRHLRLVTTLFDLLHSAVKNTHTDELKGTSIPISMLPIFFHIETLNIDQWRRLISILMEMIRFAPAQLNIPQHPEEIHAII